MNKLAVLLGLTLVLASCASPTQLRGGKADIDAMTDKPAERVAGCIGDKFEEQNVGTFGIRSSTRPTSAGYSIAVDQAAGLMGGSDTLYLVDITKVDDKTHVTMFDHVLAGNGKWVALVRGCL